MKNIIEKFRQWLVGAIREGVAPSPPAKPPLSGYRQLMRLQAARSLLADGVSIPDAARAVGIEPGDLRRWLARRRVTR